MDAMAKILVVDNDTEMLFAIQICLESAGHEMTGVGDWIEGWQAIKANKPDLIILAVMIDSTLEDLQLAFILRSPNPLPGHSTFADIPILMLTAVSSTKLLRFEPEKDDLPVDGFANTPIDPDDFLQKIAALV
jgi:CheY-like chemotaxis protein